MKATFVSRPLARREFLRISSTAVVGIAASGLINPKALLAATTATGAAFQPLLSIGYAPHLPWGDGAVALTAADSNLYPDPLFIQRGARVTVLGSSRSQNQKNAPGSLFLDAIFQANSGASSDNSRFGFWSVAGHPVRDSFSNKVSFNVPVLATTGLSFLARYARPNIISAPTSGDMPPIEQDNTPFTLSLGAVPGPKLQGGVYVVALREAADDASAPNWDRLRITKDNGRVAVDGATFGYVVLTVDYGDGSSPNKAHRRIS
jgi:hypothetical protein